MITELNFKCFSVVKESEGKPSRTFHFTTNDSPVTVNGTQFIPLSAFDQEAWGLLSNKEPSQDHSNWSEP